MTLRAPLIILLLAASVGSGVAVEMAGAVSHLETEATVFPATGASKRGIGINYEVEVGPTGGPYDLSRFYLGVNSTEAGGRWAERDNILCLSYNRKHCGGGFGSKILKDEHTFAWTWEASYKRNEDSPTWIENNITVMYEDGTIHRPWAFRVDTDNQTSWLSFQSTPSGTDFQITATGTSSSVAADNRTSIASKCGMASPTSKTTWRSMVP